VNEKSIIFRLIPKSGISVYAIAKALGTSESQIYRYLGDEKIPRETEVKLKRLWLDLIEMEGELKKIK
jgi:predicted DNA-binding transcriptional regulator AlpA